MYWFCILLLHIKLFRQSWEWCLFLILPPECFWIITVLSVHTECCFSLYSLQSLRNCPPNANLGPCWFFFTFSFLSSLLKLINLLFLASFTDIRISLFLPLITLSHLLPMKPSPVFILQRCICFLHVCQHVYVWLSESLCATYMQNPTKARRWCQMPWDWSYTCHSFDARPANQAGSSKRTVCTLNCWGLPSAPVCLYYQIVLGVITIKEHTASVCMYLKIRNNEQKPLPL